MREPLKDIVKEAVEELETESDSDTASGRSSSKQFVLLAVLSAVAAVYLANRRRGNSPLESTGMGGRHDAGERDESAREEITLGASRSGSHTSDSEQTSGTESGSRDDLAGPQDESANEENGENN